ncbi:anti-sigma factor domain-containing protein [Geodermatophilus ruber]|uniref:Regulator of SigK n=1 Tax=Geodermatophilus ruber TaxID=504800 RepID=A0A1I4FJE5_9ACTN|nr:anti-sigma factor [Geodermatophilus ruber]SFL17430.1 Anti-sigma-K factor rskA [Geodermatophilus ruber]
MSAHPGPAARREGHERFDQLAVGWALHALEPEEEALVAAHLPECLRCLRTVAETAEVMGAMATDLPQPSPAERLRAQLRAAVEQTPQVPRLDDPPGPAEPAGPVPAARPGRDPTTGPPDYRVPPPLDDDVAPSAWRRVLPNALVAAVVAAILALGTWNVVLGTARDEARTAAAEQAGILNALLAPGRTAVAALSDDDGAAVATVVVRTGQLQVVTHGLPVNDDERQTYVVWGIGEGADVALGTFDVVHPRMELKTVGSASTGPDGYATYGISLEPGRQAPPEPSEYVAIGEVPS